MQLQLGDRVVQVYRKNPQPSGKVTGSACVRASCTFEYRLDPSMAVTIARRNYNYG